MNEPLDLTPELAHKERIEQLKEMRKHDKNPFFQVARYEVRDMISEMTLRFTQYSHTLYSVDFRVLQTVQDFQYLIEPLQTFVKKHSTRERMTSAKVNMDKPVASLKDGKMIYFRNNVFTLEKGE